MLDEEAGKVPGVSPLGGSRRAARQPSIKDIARLARVSHPTVSRALQNSPLVNSRTAERIRKIAERIGLSRQCRRARVGHAPHSRTIGLVVTTVADPFTSEVVSGIEQAANDRGYCVFLADSNADPAREQKSGPNVCRAARRRDHRYFLACWRAVSAAAVGDDGSDSSWSMISTPASSCIRL
jgi:transcriptional regulator with XRE-family HTH domain